MSDKNSVRVNEEIRVPEVRLIDQDGNQLGVLKIREALMKAEEAGMDLVEVSPMAKPPVCRLMDFGKFQFEQSKKRALQRKKQKLIQIKEVKFRPGTEEGDYQVKVKKIGHFIERGDKVKVSLRFRGRELQHRELGLELLERIKHDMPSTLVEQEPRLEGKQITMLLSKGKEKEA